MRAAVFYGDHDVRIESRPVPARSAGEALIRVMRSGMCGTDATEWRAGPLSFPIDRPHPISGHLGPMTLGHEFVGEVLEADPAGHFAVGDLVASGAGIWCGKCVRCREGRPNLCALYYTLGISADGGMAEFVSCPERALVRVPEGLSINHAGLAQPLAVGLHAARRSGVVGGGRVVLIGAGAIGSFVLAGLLSLAAVDVTAVDFPGTRLERAMRIGATRTVAAGAEAPGNVRDLLGGGADVVIEASGAPGQLDVAVSMVRPGGTILQVGLPSAQQGVDIHSVVMHEITVRTTLAHICEQDLEPALRILANTNLGAEMLDSVRPLSDLAEQLELLARGGLEGKVLFDPALDATTLPG
jgi:(R,R)-butanediol dehydrogenase/meso-butanediol dehydrogenase/diacetyl reductase